MAIIVQTTNSIGPGTRIELPTTEDQITFIEDYGVGIVSTDAGDGVVSIEPDTFLNFQIYGRIIGRNAIFVQGTQGSLTVTNAPTGLLVGTMEQAIFSPGATSITNYGTIIGDAGSIKMGAGFLNNWGTIDGFVTLDGSTNVANHGTIGNEVRFMATSGDNLFVNTGTMDDVQDNAGMGTGDDLLNLGTMTGFGANGKVPIHFINAGTLSGSVSLDCDDAVFDSTLGRVLYDIQANHESTVVAGNTGNMVFGDNDDQILYANPTQAAADNASHTVLLPGRGNNALYGGSGFTTFRLVTDPEDMPADPGDPVIAPYNQIWGGWSKMPGVVGYTNNTVSFEDAIAGVYVDLVEGHNAYAVIAPGLNWGSVQGYFEDSIQNVPNVVGSGFGDVLIADNGIDRLTGGLKADQMYAGAGLLSQDTFVYQSYQDSTVNGGYDTIVGFKVDTDKIDVSALRADPDQLVITSLGNYSSVYVEHTPGTFNPNSDLAISIETTGGAVKRTDIIM